MNTTFRTICTEEVMRLTYPGATLYTCANCQHRVCLLSDLNSNSDSASDFTCPRCRYLHGSLCDQRHNDAVMATRTISSAEDAENAAETDEEGGEDPDIHSYGYDPHNHRTIGQMYGAGQLGHRCTGSVVCPACRAARTPEGNERIASWNCYAATKDANHIATAPTWSLS